MVYRFLELKIEDAIGTLALARKEVLMHLAWSLQLKSPEP